MAIIINESLQNLQADSWGGSLNSGFIDIYDGTIPADPNSAPAGTLLVSCALQADAYAAAVAGVATANLTITGTAVATGAATYAQQRNGANTQWAYAVVTDAGGAGPIKLTTATLDTQINLDDTVSFTVSTITQPSGV